MPTQSIDEFFSTRFKFIPTEKDNLLAHEIMVSCNIARKKEEFQSLVYLVFANLKYGLATGKKIIIPRRDYWSNFNIDGRRLFSILNCLVGKYGLGKIDGFFARQGEGESRVARFFIDSRSNIQIEGLVRPTPHPLVEVRQDDFFPVAFHKLSKKDKETVLARTRILSRYKSLLDNFEIEVREGELERGEEGDRIGELEAGGRVEKREDYKEEGSLSHILGTLSTFSQEFHTLPDRQKYVILDHNLRCVFNRSSTDFGGRIYSTASTLPKAARKTLTINGQETVELDFSYLHISMIMNSEGKALQHDPYVYAAGDPRRDVIKLAILVALNAKDSATGLRAALDKILSVGIKITNPELKKILKEFIKTNPDIEKYLYSDIGIRLQRQDSNIAFDIVEYFTRKDIPVLCIHDSFIIAKEHKQELNEVMKEVYFDYFGFYPEIH